MGLAPQIVEEIFEIVRDLNTKERVSFLLAEQNTTVALRYADYGYILENGRVVMDGEAKALGANEDVKEFYLGLSSGGRRSFRDVKHYRRRKRLRTAGGDVQRLGDIREGHYFVIGSAFRVIVGDEESATGQVGQMLTCREEATRSIERRRPMVDCHGSDVGILLRMIVDEEASGGAIGRDEPARAGPAVEKGDASRFLGDTSEAHRVDERRRNVGLGLRSEAPDPDSLLGDI
jgi:hypothetical protein